MREQKIDQLPRAIDARPALSGLVARRIKCAYIDQISSRAERGLAWRRALASAYGVVVNKI